MEILLSDIEKVAEKILLALRESYPEKAGDDENDDIMVQCQDVNGNGNGSACYLYKHRKNVSGDKWRYDVIRMLIRGIDYSHALCLHFCDGSSEFHVYSKKGWLSFCPDKDALVITIGDQTQALSGGQFKHVIGRPIYNNGDNKEDHISMAFLYSPPTDQVPTPSINISGSSKPVDLENGKNISLSQQGIAALRLTLVYHLLLYVYNKF